MTDRTSPEIVAVALLAALDTRSWEDVAAYCAEEPLEALRDRAAQLIDSMRENGGAFLHGDGAEQSLHAYGNDLPDAAALRLLTPRAFFVRFLSRPNQQPAPGPRMIDEVIRQDAEAVCRYRRAAGSTFDLRLIRTTVGWQAVPNADVLSAVTLSPSLWQRRFGADC